MCCASLLACERERDGVVCVVVAIAPASGEHADRCYEALLCPVLCMVTMGTLGMVTMGTLGMVTMGTLDTVL